jgi:hypothetical protein
MKRAPSLASAAAVLIVPLMLLIGSSTNARAQTTYPGEVYLPPAASQTKMTVNDVIKLSKAGLSDGVIIQQIKKKGQPFDLSTDDLLQLKSSHVSDRVIEAMTESHAPEETARGSSSQQAVGKNSAATVLPPNSGDQGTSRSNAGSTLRIVNDHLVKVNDGDCIGCLYAVKGSIYNPNNDGVKNVVIKYYIWKKWMGTEGHGSIIRDTGGLVAATINYLPPKQTVEFLATSGNAGVMTEESGLLPDPISAEITADWDRQ